MANVRFEDLLQVMGGAGPFQILMFVLLGIVNLYTGMENLAINFMAPKHPHWCRVPVLDKLPYDVMKRLAIPYDETIDDFHSCQRYDYDISNLTGYDVNWDDFAMIDLEMHRSNATVTCENGWMFDMTEFHKTATSQWLLVCDDAWILDLISPVYTCGLLVGSIIGGIVSDRFGRLRSLCFFLLVHFLAAMGVTFAADVWMFIVMRFIIAVSLRGAGLTGAVLLMEMLSPRLRTAALAGYQMFLGLGIVVVAAVATVVHGFHALQFLISIPLIPMLLSYWWLLPESPRWLLSKRRNPEVLRVVKNVARFNRRKIHEHDPIIQDLQINQAVITTSKDEASSMNFLDLFRHPVLRRYSIVCHLLIMVAFFIDIGVSLNVSALFGDVYDNVRLTGATQIGANFLVYFGILWFGRRPPIVFCFSAITISAGTAVLFQAIEYRLTASVLSIICRCLASSATLTLSIYVGELFPTPVRQVALGSCNAFAAAVAIAAPLVGSMDHIWYGLPNLIFGCLALLSAPLAFFLPETQGQLMPESLDDALELDRNSKGTRRDCTAVRKEKLMQMDIEQHRRRSASNKVVPDSSLYQTSGVFATPESSSHRTAHNSIGGSMPSLRISNYPTEITICHSLNASDLEGAAYRNTALSLGLTDSRVAETVM